MCSSTLEWKVHILLSERKLCAMTTQEVVSIYFIDTSRRIHMSPNKSGIALLRTAVMDSVEQSDETQL